MLHLHKMALPCLPIVFLHNLQRHRNWTIWRPHVYKSCTCSTTVKVTKSVLISLIFLQISIHIYTNQPFIKTFSKYSFNVIHRRLHRTISFNCCSVYISSDQAASYFTDNNSGRLGDYVTAICLLPNQCGECRKRL